MADYGLDAEPHALELLRLALEALERGEQAGKILRAEGLVVTTKGGDRRAHPAVAIKRDAEKMTASLFRELSLDAEIGAPA